MICDLHTRFWVGRIDVKRPLARPRQRCQDNIKMDLREVGCAGMYWIDPVLDWDIWGFL
jgi:hypothetical protein